MDTCHLVIKLIKERRIWNRARLNRVVSWLRLRVEDRIWFNKHHDFLGQCFGSFFLRKLSQCVNEPVQLCFGPLLKSSKKLKLIMHLYSSKNYLKHFFVICFGWINQIPSSYKIQQFIQIFKRFVKTKWSTKF